MCGQEIMSGFFKQSLVLRLKPKNLSKDFHQLCQVRLELVDVLEISSC